LDLGALTRALGEIVRRHEVLRTRFEAVTGMPDSDPVQVIEPLPELPFPLVDLAGLEEPARRAAAVELTRREARRSFGRYTGQTDLALGSPIANRNLAEIEPLLGFFVNTLVLRGDLSGDPTVRRLLARVRDVALGAYAHQDLPFEKLVEELEPERTLSQNPLVQVLFVLQNAPMASPELAPGLRVELEEVATGEAKFDLTLALIEGEGGLHGAVEYGTDLFDAVTIRRLVGHFHTVLEAVVGDPEGRLSQLPLLGAAEAQQLLREWIGNPRLYPRDASIHELFEDRVAAAPEAVAVALAGSDPPRQVSYRELNRQANRLAHYLRARGVGRSSAAPELCVGLCVERSLEMVVAILGILKAGGVYVPLDPTYPAERLAFMLEDLCSPDGRAAVLVVQERLAEKLAIPASVLSELRLVRLESDESAISEYSPENPRPEVTAENLAYVMYTSGSTGRPKGVGAVHRGLVRLVKETDYARLNAGEVFLQFAPISFDASTLEIWGALV
ncbi:MAG: AMP-binding protein, partial [bacterium]|nr:AMP-binding protein [bacterium]